MSTQGCGKCDRSAFFASGVRYVKPESSRTSCYTCVRLEAVEDEQLPP